MLEPPGAARDNIQFLHHGAVLRMAETHLERLAAIDGGASARIVDKMPDNYMYIGLLAIMFPRAAFIHCKRDLRDIAVSCWMTDFRSIRWSNDLNTIAARFQQYHRVMSHWKEVLPLPILEVDYEETVTDLEGTARRMIETCGLAWEPACLDFHRTDARSAPPASCRCASRSTSGLLPAGRTMRPISPNSLLSCRKIEARTRRELMFGKGDRKMKRIFVAVFALIALAGGASAGPRRETAGGKPVI